MGKGAWFGEEFSIARCVTFVIDVVLMIGGYVLLTYGITMKNKMKHAEVFTINAIQPIPICTVVIGIAVFVFSFFSCYAACKRNACCIISCCIIISWLLLVQVAIGITMFLYKEKMHQVINFKMHLLFKNYQTNEISQIGWEDLQENKKCCGIENFQDWLTTLPTSDLPESCCYGSGTICTSERKRKKKNIKKVYENGCYEKVIKDLNLIIYQFVILNSVLGIFELEVVIYGLFYVRGHDKGIIHRKDSTSSSTSSTL